VSLQELPPDLPVPQDDRACDHLPGRELPDLFGLRAPGVLVLYLYPHMGDPSVGVPAGWDAIPGARGCTPQSCGFRDLHGEIAATGARVVGLSTQSAEEQDERADRLHLPFALVSDPELRLRDALGLPTFEFPGRGELYRRLTLVARDGVIERVFYPVFPPDRNAADVLAYLRASADRAS
jgi:peroxiredoxin